MKGQVGQFTPQGFIPGISLFGLILGGSGILARMSLSKHYVMSRVTNTGSDLYAESKSLLL